MTTKLKPVKGSTDTSFDQTSKLRTASAGAIDEQRALGAFNTSSALEMLFRTARAALTTSELEWLAQQASSHAIEISRRASAVAQGVGCLVLADDGAEGNFQSSDDVSDLLFHFSGVFEHVAGLTRISDEAAYLLRERGAA
jgi:hypothetical protein